MRLLRRSLAIALLCLVAVAGGAAAQDAGSDSASANGIVALQAEILLLVELDAFETVPAPLSDVHRQWVSQTNGFTRNGLLMWLDDVDADGARALDRLIATGVRPTSAVRTALGVISSADRVSLESGATIAIAPGDYVAALQTLTTERGVAARSVLRPPETTSLSAAGAVADEPTQPAAATPARRATQRYPWASVTLALLSVAIAGMALVLVGRRRDLPPASGKHFDRLLDAGRRMAGVLDREEIAAIAVDEAIVLSGARCGAFIRVQDRALALGYQTDDVVDDRRLDAGVLARVAATGRSARLVASDEPSITSLPAALLAVPVIGGGRVTGIVLLVRPDSAPFTEGDATAIGQLAPMVGSAMAAAELHGGVAELSRTDSLTGLGNRRRLDGDLAAALMAAEADRRVGVIMLDVDHFKVFNDTHGHTAGDEALAAIGGALRAHVRTGDTAYRYGGEEFALVLRDVDETQAVEVAERIRAAVAALDVAGAATQPGGRLTISCGLVLVAGGDVDDTIGAADAALYEAKHRGRDRLVVGSAGIPAAG